MLVLPWVGGGDMGAAGRPAARPTGKIILQPSFLLSSKLMLEKMRYEIPGFSPYLSSSEEIVFGNSRKHNLSLHEVVCLSISNAYFPSPSSCKINKYRLGGWRRGRSKIWVSLGNWI